MALIKELQGLDPIYVFAGKNGMMSDKVMGRAMRRLFEIGALDIEPVRPHDFRRTVRTHLEKLNVAPHIAEKCLRNVYGITFRNYNVGFLFQVEWSHEAHSWLRNE